MSDPSTRPARVDLLARARQVAAFVILGILAALHVEATWSIGGLGGIETTWSWVAYFLCDPTNYFFLLSLAGVGLGLFWGRYLAICFMVNLLVLGLARGCPVLAPMPLAMEAVVLLLAGRRMRELFEGRAAGRFNRWAVAHPKVYRLRWLVLLQSVMLALLFCTTGFGMSLMTRLAVTCVVGVALLGMVFQKTWSLFLLVIASVLELVLVFQLGAELARFAPYIDRADLAWFLVPLALVVGSLVLALPVAWAALRRLRHSGAAGSRPR